MVGSEGEKGQGVESCVAARERLMERRGSKKNDGSRF